MFVLLIAASVVFIGTAFWEYHVEQQELRAEELKALNEEYELICREHR
jgi:hypothetical protein